MRGLRIGDCQLFLILFIFQVILLGRGMTASEAKEKGLVSDVIWPDRFLEDIVPRLETLAAQPNFEAIKATKKLLKRRVREELDKVAEDESKELVASWTTKYFPRTVKKYLEAGNFVMQ